MWRRTVPALVAATVVLGGCAGVEDDRAPRNIPEMHEAVPFDLYTHCGIHELQVGGRFFVRVGGPLTDGSGNPPPGWDNPSQPGRLVVTDGSAVFTDDRGHREEFRLREGASEFLNLCA